MTRLRCALAVRGKDLCDVVYDGDPPTALAQIGPRRASLDFPRLVRIANYGDRPTDDEAATLAMLLDFPPRYFQMPPYPPADGPTFVCGPGTGAAARCRFCEQPAAFLCDHVMGDGGTCDREICAGCAEAVGDDVHLCPEHEGDP